MIPDLFDPLCAPFRLEGSNHQAVVLVHGFTGVPAHFRPLARFLNDAGYTVNVPLLAGHGTNPGHMATTGRRDWLRSVEQAVAAVADHRRVHLVGLSMGGLLSILVAACSAAATVTTINSPVILRHKQTYLAPLAHRLHPMVTWPEDGTPPLDDEVRHLWLTYPGFPTVKTNDLLAVIARATVVAGRLRRPSLVIQSRADETVDPRSGTILAHRLGSGCRLVWLDHAIHNALLDGERHLVHRAVLERIA